MKDRILVSACLLGCACRYDGTEKQHPAALRLAEQYEVIPVCPEQMGGLATPRPPAERSGNTVVTAAGADVTAQYRHGAEEILRLAKLFDCRMAVMKERSPSCGHGEIYDGSFSRTLISGDGMTAELLRQEGIRVLGESEIEEVLL